MNIEQAHGQHFYVHNKVFMNGQADGLYYVRNNVRMDGSRDGAEKEEEEIEEEVEVEEEISFI